MSIRWMVHDDLSIIPWIEQSAPDPWGEGDYIALLGQRNVVARVSVDESDTPVATMVYAIQRQRVDVLRLLVAKQFRRQGHATALLSHLTRPNARIKRFRFDVPEECLDLQLFLRTFGFRATRILGDVYRFWYNASTHARSQ